MVSACGRREYLDPNAGDLAGFEMFFQVLVTFLPIQFSSNDYSLTPGQPKIIHQ